MGKPPPTTTPTEDAGSIADLLRAVAETPETMAPRLPQGMVLHDTHRLTRFIGEGGMGAVYEAVHVRLKKKRFAIKVLKVMQTGSQTPYARFRREAEIATELGHPNIVDVLDFYETEEGRPGMVMELLEGEDLEARLQSVGRLTPTRLVPILRQVGCALQSAHDHGVVHRDLKPANIFLVRTEAGSDEELVKLLDFGISKIRDDNTVLTSNVAMIGTPQYMSPEQGIGQSIDVDHTTDIFALGIICYQVLSGKLPFDAPTVPGVLYKICHEDPPSITELVREPPPAVPPVLLHALAKTRTDRYQRVETFVEEMCEALQAPTGARPPEEVVLPPASAVSTADTLAAAPDVVEKEQPPRQRWQLVVALVLVIGALVGGVVLLVGRGGTDSSGTDSSGAASSGATPSGPDEPAGAGPAAAPGGQVDATTAKVTPHAGASPVRHDGKGSSRARRPRVRAGRDEPVPQLDGGQRGTRRRIYDKLDDTKAAPKRPDKKKIYDDL